MKDKKRVWLSAFRHVVPADYERWFEEKEAQGWHVDKIGQWSSILMTFRRAEPRQYRYVVDMQFSHRRDYIAMYEQFGWEFVGQMASSYVWRREYTHKRPESFTDIENIERRNKRFALAVLINLILFSLATAAIAFGFIVTFGETDGEQKAQFILGITLCALFAGYLWYVWRKILKNRNK
jgi:hypothetical protein